MLILIIVIFIIVMYMLRLFEFPADSIFQTNYSSTVNNRIIRLGLFGDTLQVPVPSDLEHTSQDVKTSDVLGPVEPDVVVCIDKTTYEITI